MFYNVSVSVSVEPFGRTEAHDVAVSLGDLVAPIMFDIGVTCKPFNDVNETEFILDAFVDADSDDDAALQVNGARKLLVESLHSDGYSVQASSITMWVDSCS